MFNLVQKVYAANDAASGVSVTVINPLSSRFTTVGAIFGFATNVLIGIGWGLVFIMLAYGFIRYIMSKGDKNETQSAQSTLTYAVIGGVGLLAIGIVRTIVANILGIGVGEVGISSFVP